ncbi:hypothetical protein ABp57_gp60 [Acinetobacter phage ABp57]|nr:hypothetical protein ABp57_gp60 [Acinetobacter phage ABp57]
MNYLLQVILIYRKFLNHAICLVKHARILSSMRAFFFFEVTLIEGKNLI